MRTNCTTSGLFTVEYDQQYNQPPPPPLAPQAPPMPGNQYHSSTYAPPVQPQHGGQMYNPNPMNQYQPQPYPQYHHQHHPPVYNNGPVQQYPPRPQNLQSWPPRTPTYVTDNMPQSNMHGIRPNSGRSLAMVDDNQYMQNPRYPTPVSHYPNTINHNQRRVLPQSANSYGL